MRLIACADRTSFPLEWGSRQADRGERDEWKTFWGSVKEEMWHEPTANCRLSLDGLTSTLLQGWPGSYHRAINDNEHHCCKFISLLTYTETDVSSQENRKFDCQRIWCTHIGLSFSDMLLTLYYSRWVDVTVWGRAYVCVCDVWPRCSAWSHVSISESNLYYAVSASLWLYNGQQPHLSVFRFLFLRSCVCMSLYACHMLC